MQKSRLPAATGLDAANDETGIKLTWNRPDLQGITPEPVTEDFEDADAFSAEYGDWTFVDVDQSPVGGFQDTDIPGIDTGVTTGSFWIWDSDELVDTRFVAHSGSKFLFALFRYDEEPTDDWAISPELSDEEQTISFYTRSLDFGYPEKIEVLYSTGSKNPADFVLIPNTTVPQVPNEWTRYTAKLPAGAKHFAIRSYATASFMLMVDDVTYTPADITADLEVEGYNVYRDGVKINETPVSDCEYLDTNVIKDSQYIYTVTVVYVDKGESKASNEVAITSDVNTVDGIGDGAVSIRAAGGKIAVLNAEGMEVTVASVDGAVIYSGQGKARTEIAAGKGVYVVTAGRTVRKVIVR